MISMPQVGQMQQSSMCYMKINRWWLGICGDMERNVWFTPGRVIGTRTIGTMADTQWVSAKQAYPWLVDTPLSEHTILSHCGWLWHQICWQRQCQTPQTGPQTVLQNHSRLGRGKYVGLTINWQCETRQVHMSMLRYIAKALIWLCNTSHTPTCHHNMADKSNMHP